MNECSNYTAAEQADARRRERARARELRNRRKRRIRRLVLIILILALAVTGAIVGVKFFKGRSVSAKVKALGQAEVPAWVDGQILPFLSASRRGVKLEDITAIVIHYVGNPGTTAQQNRDYYGSPGTEVNSHFLVGLDGEIIQCIPLDEKSSATSERNRDTISIEVCHPDESGKFNEESYESLVKLTAWLCDQCGFDSSSVIRHYDATGKLCPLYYVENEGAWQQFLSDVDDARSPE